MLTLSNLSFQADQHEILSDITTSFPDGSFTVITGPNGGGKSTLARLIMGIEQPTSGSVYWNDIDITNLTIAERAKQKIGYAFQQPPRFKGMSVKKLLTLAHGKALTHEQCCEYLSAVGLCANDYLNRDVDQSLSGGEVKRIEIATLLARDLDLAIFDEPEAGIDLWSFNSNLMSILLISHQERIMRMADEIVVIENGRIARRGDRDQILPSLMQDFNSCEYKK